MRGLGRSAGHAFLFTLSYLLSGALLVPVLQLYILPWLYGPKDTYASLLGYHMASALMILPSSWATTLLAFRLFKPGEWFFSPVRAGWAGVALVLLNWGGPMLWAARRLPQPSAWVASWVGSNGVLAIQALSPLVIFSTAALGIGWALPPWKHPREARSDPS